MNRDTLNTAISDGPIRITMNDGTTYDIQDQKSMLVDATTAYVLQRASDGRVSHNWNRKKFYGEASSGRSDRESRSDIAYVDPSLRRRMSTMLN